MLQQQEHILAFLSKCSIRPVQSANAPSSCSWRSSHSSFGPRSWITAAPAPLRCRSCTLRCFNGRCSARSRHRSSSPLDSYRDGASGSLQRYWMYSSFSMRRPLTRTSYVVDGYTLRSEPYCRIDSFRRSAIGLGPSRRLRARPRHYSLGPRRSDPNMSVAFESGPESP